MRLSISNIAWDASEDDAVAGLLNARGVAAIDVAPGKYFPIPGDATDREMEDVRRRWEVRGIAIVGMQALLFGTHGLNLFGTADVQHSMLEHLAAVCRIGSGLGATRLVFGSPRNRDRSGLDDTVAFDHAVVFFRRLGDIARANGVEVCLEPNPACYGANFMTTSAETAHIVARVGHPAIRMQFDTGSLAINGEDASVVLADYASLIGHVHASEPDLLPLGDTSTDHAELGRLLAKHLPEHIVTVEMRATENEPHLTSIDRALRKAAACYGDRAGAGS
jgi:sugar phosphate isomerase/epimerase